MKKYIILLSVILISFYSGLNANTIVYFGDSRATELAMSEWASGDYQWKGVVSTAKINGVRIIDDGQIYYNADPTGYYNIPGTTTSNWILPMTAQFLFGSYDYPITIISLGGNDILETYSKLAKHQAVVFWIRSVLDPFYFLSAWNRGQMDAVDELFWLWRMNSATDISESNVSLIYNMILLKNPNNKVIVNDVAPVFQASIEPIDPSNFDWREFFRVNLYIQIYNHKLARGMWDSQLDKVFVLSNRLDYLYTSHVFFNNLVTFYLIDGVHFNEAGLVKWGELFAQRCVTKGWLTGYDGLDLPPSSDPLDVNPPTLENLPNGSWTNELPLIWGLPVGPLPLTFTVKDDRGINEVFVDGAKCTDVIDDTSTPKEYEFTVTLPRDGVEGNHVHYVTVYDYNNNSASFRIDYTKTIIAVWPALNLWWFGMRLDYTSTEL